MIDIIKQRARAMYFYEYGGMKLNPHEKGNDNGPLFAAVYYALLARAGKLTLDDKLQWLDMMRKIEVKKGIYQRYPGSTLVEAHDNYIGHLLAARVFDVPYVWRDIESVKWKNYNDIPPHEFRWETQRQPGDQAIYSLAAGKNPNWLFLAHLSIGLGLASVLNLVWCRVELLRILWPNLSWMQKFILRPGLKKWFKKMRHAYVDKTIISHYYADPNHPNSLLAKEISLLDSDWWLD